MKANPAVWFEIYVQDMARAKAFYQAVFQGELTPLANPDQGSFPGLEMWAFPSSMEKLWCDRRLGENARLFFHRKQHAGVFWL